MTASSADTAELPVIDRATVVDPPVSLRVTSADLLRLPSAPSRFLVAPPAPCRPGRMELRAERQLVRRQQQRLALLGLSILAATFGAAAAVLDLVH